MTTEASKINDQLRSLPELSKGRNVVRLASLIGCQAILFGLGFTYIFTPRGADLLGVSPRYATKQEESQAADKAWNHLFESLTPEQAFEHQYMEITTLNVSSNRGGKGFLKAFYAATTPFDYGQDCLAETPYDTRTHNDAAFKPATLTTSGDPHYAVLTVTPSNHDIPVLHLTVNSKQHEVEYNSAADGRLLETLGCSITK